MTIIEKLLGQGPKIKKYLEKEKRLLQLEDKYCVGDVIVAYDDKGLFAEAFITNKDNTKLKNVVTKEIYPLSLNATIDSAVRAIVIKKNGVYRKLFIEDLYYSIAHFGGYKLNSTYFTSEGKRKEKGISVYEISRLLKRIEEKNKECYQKAMSGELKKNINKNENSSILDKLSDKTRDF